MAILNKKQRRIKNLQKRGNTYCPLCMCSFNSIVIPTLEHIPPKKLGGQVKCLTCKDCNQKTGDTIERSLINSKHDKVVFQELNTPKKKNLSYTDIKIKEKAPLAVAKNAGPETLRAYYKIAYLALGSATNGFIWNKYFSEVREFILDGGNIPLGTNWIMLPDPYIRDNFIAYFVSKRKDICGWIIGVDEFGIIFFNKIIPIIISDDRVISQNYLSNYPLFGTQSNNWWYNNQNPLRVLVIANVDSILEPLETKERLKNIDLVFPAYKDISLQHIKRKLGL